MDRIALLDANVFDANAGVLLPHRTVVIEGERIVDVLADATPVDDARRIDLAGRTLLPGLIDAHVHVTATRADFQKLAIMPSSLVSAESKDVLWGMLMRGFTTVRDAAGADFGLVEAVERGLFPGPRLFIAGQAISQTGGHGDVRPLGAQRLMCACAGLGLLGTIADGVAEVRKAAREQLRNGAHQLKLMASGGIASPTDPIDGTQYSVDELRAICEEAEAANTYTMAHAYTPRAIERAVRAGVRSIEHGNLLDDASARVMAEHGAWLVPTLATYDSLAREGTKLGWSASMLAKLDRVKDEGVQSLRHAKAAGVPIGFGTDLLGHMHQDQSNEFVLRSPALTPVELLQGATSVNARLMGLEGHIGVVAAGAFADLVVVDGDPTRDLSLLLGQGARMPLIMKAGRLMKDQLGAGS